MAASYAGQERRRTIGEAQIKEAVKEAVAEALKGANLIDGPTHIAHHQAFEDFLALTKHAKKTFVGAVVMGFIALLMLGVAAWKAN